MIYRVHPCVKRNYRAFVDWVIDGRRNRKYFASEAKAKVWMEARNREVKNSGMNAYALPEATRVQAQEATLLLAPFGKTIMDAVNLAVPIWREAQKSCLVKEGVEKLLTHKNNKRKRGIRGGSVRYCDDLRLRLAKFVESFGEQKVSGISKLAITEWLDGLPGGSVNRNNTQRVLSVFWEFARKKEWCIGNPVKEIDQDEAANSAIEVLSPKQAASLLFHAPKRIILHLAIGMFCGLRRSELERLGPDSIKWDAGLIEAQVTKTRGAARRFVKMRHNLRAWLLGCGPIQKLTARQFQKDIAEAIKASGIAPWPHNALRHSFCSYALAHERNLNDLTLEMGHTNPHTLFAHYRELVTPVDASGYWRLTPARVIRLEKGC